MKQPFTLCLDRTFPADAAPAASIHVAVADVSALLSDADLLAQTTTTLSPQRQAKAAAISNLRNRALSVGVALLFDELLMRVGLRERNLIYIERTHGKPTVANDGLTTSLAFNLSHSGHMVAAALCLTSDGTPAPALGIDVQHVTTYRPELVRRVFSDADRQRLAAATTEADRQYFFCRLWSRAEACAKATGLGLQWPFPPPPAGSQLLDLDITADYCASLCVLPPIFPTADHTD